MVEEDVLCQICLPIRLEYIYCKT